MTSITPPPRPEDVAGSLTAAQRHALWRIQEQLFEGRATVTGHGMTMRAFRSRGIVSGAMPFAYITPFGREVMAAARLSSSDGA